MQPASGGGSKGGAGGGPELLTALAEECFGGMASNSKLHSNLRAGKGTRNNNAFVLFYEREPSDRHMPAHTPPHTRAREELVHTHTDAAAAAARQVITLHFTCCTSAKSTNTDTSGAARQAGTQFTCCTSTKVQILTPADLRDS
jgi:hypothetical protein